MDLPKIEIPLIEKPDEIISETIGIDIGQTLIKIAYIDGNQLTLSIFNTNDGFKELKSFLETKKDSYKVINFTGGRAYDLSIELSKSFATTLLDEFQANSLGIEELFRLNKKKVLSSSLVISIGTGTSITSKKESFKHIGGSALGGAFFLSFISLFGITSFQEAMELSKRGDRYAVDLKVSDIYDTEDDRIDSVFREFTAASFGKVKNINLVKKEDLIHSLISLIAENIGMIACFMADKEKIKNLVFCGGFTIENKILVKALKRICMIQGKKAIFLKNSEYMGAIGALKFRK